VKNQSQTLGVIHNAHDDPFFVELTFIILARANPGLVVTSPNSVHELPMIGDVNLFLKDVETDDGDRKEAEVEIMIAGSLILFYH
jgi:hypothetical protein